MVKKKTNPKSPWRKHNGGLGPLSDKAIKECLDPEANKNRSLAGVLDAEFFENPPRLTQKELEELL